MAQTVTTLGRLLNELTTIRWRSGMTQEQVANKVGISRAAVCRLENSAHNDRSPNLSTLLRYATAIGAEIRVELSEPVSP
jgi:transcriptional regulator with XRE-family HTH domain